MSFSNLLSEYLQTVYGEKEKASGDLDAAKAQLEGSGDGRNQLVKALGTVMVQDHLQDTGLFRAFMSHLAFCFGPGRMFSFLDGT